jgi:asparagine synthase (glutamine-hydrolysing)
MCGLIYSTSDFSSKPAIWEEALRVIDCRGPDNLNTKFSKHGSFGHSRLEIIGLGAPGKQPFSLDLDVDCLIYNGEIYNYQEIAANLGINSESDTSVLYQILNKKNYQFLSQIRGMYAFIYVNFKENYIVSGRDKFGIKPLYFMNSGDGEISFASVPAALMKIDATRKINLVALMGFIASGLFHAGSSILENIYKISPGSILLWKKINGRWEDEDILIEPRVLPRVDLKSALGNSVKMHLTSDVPVGVLMSGGIDSTLIAAIASKYQSNIDTYCLINPDYPSIDESFFAKRNAELIGANHTEVRFNIRDAKNTIIKLIESTGEPFSDAAYIPLSILCQSISGKHKVVLAGEGADEIFGGYKRYQVEKYGQSKIYNVLIKKIASKIVGDNYYFQNYPTQKNRAISFLVENVPFVAHSKLLFGEWQATMKAFPQITQKAYEKELNIWNLNKLALKSKGINEFRAYDIREWLPNVFLEKSDRASMLNGVEVRVPFLDEMIWQNVDQSTIRNSKKQLLRRELKNLIPNVSLPEKKMGLSVAIYELNQKNGLMEDVSFILKSKESILYDYKVDSDLMVKRSQLSPEFAFRLAMLAHWQYRWS